MKNNFRLALAQMRVEGGQKAANLARAVECIAAAAAQGADLVLLPEALNLGWTDPSAATQADAIPAGDSCRRLGEAARRFGLFVCAGLVERDGPEVFNAAVLIDPSGQIVLRHRKLNELAIGHPFYGQGNSLAVAPTALGAVGVMICADAFARGQSVSRALGLMGADIILSPSAWAVPADHDQAREPYGRLWLDSYGPVARDFRLWIAGVSNVGRLTAGPWAGRKCIGCSLLIGPSGEPVLQGPYGEHAEALLIASVALEPRPARGDGWEQFWKSPAG